MLSVKNVTKGYLETLFKKVNNIISYKHYHLKERKILVNAFFEPSTRTSLSFESAMYRLGGDVITFNKDFSSLKKGESFEDTIKTLSSYGHVMAIRHPEKGAIEKAAEISDIPIINAGDGNGQHPTQALLDMYTIYRKFPELEKLKILFVGDIKNSRTVHSLVDLFSFYTTNKLYFLPYEDSLPDSDFLYNIAGKHGQEPDNMLIDKDILDISQYDVVYMTRMQKERRDYEVSPDFILTPELANQMKENSLIMHALPRNEELPSTVDSNHRAVYFEQMKYGLYVRMALLEDLTN
jgi:aspartate carbamoyltransferase